MPGHREWDLAENEYGVYCVPRESRHRLAARTILHGQVWEAETLDLLRNVDPSGDLIHAGAFFGDFLPALSRSRRTGALIWAFEPNRASHRCAGAGVRLNDLENVRLVHAGLDAEPGTATLAIRDENGTPLGGASHLVEGAGRGPEDRHEMVTLTSIDTCVGDGRRIAAIHLDVEGWERRALTGAMRTIERCRPLLVLERFGDVAWVRANLEPLGYEFDGSVDENAVFACADRRPAPR